MRVRSEMWRRRPSRRILAVKLAQLNKIRGRPPSAMLCRGASALWKTGSDPGGLSKSRRCLAIGLLECGTEVAVTGKAQVKCQIGDIRIVFEQV